MISAPRSSVSPRLSSGSASSSASCHSWVCQWTRCSLLPPVGQACCWTACLCSPRVTLTPFIVIQAHPDYYSVSTLLSISHPGTEPQRPLTSHDLPEPGVDSVGHMTSLQGARKSPGLGKPGELFLTHVLSMVLPVLPAQQRAALSLSWMQYQKLKVGRFRREKKKSEFIVFSY